MRFNFRRCSWLSLSSLYFCSGREVGERATQGPRLVQQRASGGATPACSRRCALLAASGSAQAQLPSAAARVPARGQTPRLARERAACGPPARPLCCWVGPAGRTRTRPRQGRAAQLAAQLVVHCWIEPASHTVLPSALR